MMRAYFLACQAKALGEVPVGALLVKDGKVIAGAFNLRERTQNPLAHAELLAMERASQRLNSWRLSSCSLYVTLEPCAMCLGALQESRISHLIYGASRPLKTTLQLASSLKITKGILERECSEVLKDFFKKIRD